MSQPKLSIVIPIYNEEARIGKTLEEAFVYLKKKKWTAEIILVDDGCKDKTLQIVEKFRKKTGKLIGLKVLRHDMNRGKGAAVRTGALASQGRLVLFMDADNATPLTQFDKFEPAFNEGYEVLVGSRAVDRKLVKVHQPIYREAMGRIFNILVQTLATPGIWDTQCGFKAFTREAAKSIFPQQTIERFGFDVELLYIAKKHGFRMSEIPVEWFDSPYSKVNVIRDSTRMFFDLLVVRWNDLQGRYSHFKPNSAGL